MRYVVVALLFILLGCSTKTPTETIVSESVNRIDQVIDYADANIADTPDTVFLKAELKAEQNNTAYWKLACGALVGLLVALFYFFRK